jgi:ATP-dependent Clp protease, protease subunit
MIKPTRRKKPTEVSLIGEVDDWEHDVIKDLLAVRVGGECVLYFDSMGGSVYGALAVVTLIRQRQLRCTGIVLGECSSASLLIFAACQRRVVTRYSTLLFHRMRWQSEKRVGSQEASLWAKHFDDMEKEIDALQARFFGVAEELVREWTAGSQYVSGPQLAAAGLAELLEL